MENIKGHIMALHLQMSKRTKILYKQIEMLSAEEYTLAQPELCARWTFLRVTQNQPTAELL